jgi:hypothetical protein
MDTSTLIAQALGVAYAAGISPYATVALLGAARQLQWVGPLPGGLDVVANPWVIGIAGVLFAIEFVATLVPWVASAWETVHSLVRPPAAALLAVLTAWHGDVSVAVLAGLLGGGLGLATHTTKLGLRYAIDTSPEPLSNGAANLGEMGVVATLMYFVWQYPWTSLVLALLLLGVLMVLVVVIWRTFRRAVGLLRRPGHRAADARG